MNTAVQHSLSALAERFGLELRGDGECRIAGVGTLGAATSEQLSFLSNPQYRSQLADSRAAAVVLRAGDGGATRVEASGEKLWPDTLDIMGWSVDPEGFGVIFQRTIPDFVQQYMGPAVAEIVAKMDFPLAEIGRFICHPGGAKVIAALERALSLEQGTLDHERDVIADYGNMSAPTVLFVLERALAQGLPPRSLLTALGPGFTASCVALRHAA